MLEDLGAAARFLFEARFDRAHAVNAYLETFAKCINLTPAPSSPREARVKDTAL